MGYIVWSDALIESKILECKEGLNLNRMPSANEMAKYFGNYALSNKISKGIGFYGWSVNLGLPMKLSETQTGKNGEAIAAKELEQLGYCVERMTTGYPYDLMVNAVVKVDVKFSNLYHGVNGDFYSFRLNKAYPTCDVYILIANDDNGNKKLYVVPSKDVHQKQVSIGSGHSVYEKYLGRLDFLDAYEKAFKEVC